MWLIKLVVCILRGHAYTDISMGKSPYRYCLRCGHVEVPGVHTHPAGKPA
jgi:hypothetical protein